MAMAKIKCWLLQDEAGLFNDLSFLAHLPELCDITFLVGPDKEPVCAVRAILAARSPRFLDKLYLDEKRSVDHFLFSKCQNKNSKIFLYTFSQTVFKKNNVHSPKLDSIR